MQINFFFSQQVEQEVDISPEHFFKVVPGIYLNPPEISLWRESTRFSEQTEFRSCSRSRYVYYNITARSFS